MLLFDLKRFPARPLKETDGGTESFKYSCWMFKGGFYVRGGSESKTMYKICGAVFERKVALYYK